MPPIRSRAAKEAFNHPRFYPIRRWQGQDLQHEIAIVLDTREGSAGEEEDISTVRGHGELTFWLFSLFLLDYCEVFLRSLHLILVRRGRP